MSQIIDLIDNPFITETMRRELCGIRDRVHSRTSKFDRKRVARDAKLLAAGRQLTREEWLELKKRYQVCLCCGKQTRLNRDHIINLGSKGCRNSVDNIQPLCNECNNLKGTRIIDFRYDRSSLLDYNLAPLGLYHRSWRYGYDMHTHFCIGDSSICGQTVPKRSKLEAVIGIRSARNQCVECNKILNRNFTED